MKTLYALSFSLIGCFAPETAPTNPLLFEFREASCSGESCPQVLLKRAALPTQIRPEARAEIAKALDGIVFTVPPDNRPVPNWEEAMASFQSYRAEQPEAPLRMKGVEELLFIGGSIISISYTLESYFGGAHGTTTRTLSSFSTENGRKIELDEIVTSEGKALLLTIAEGEFRTRRQISPNQKLSDGGFFDTTGGTFFLPSNFALVREGILFRFNPYEIAAFAVGGTEVLIAKEGLRPILKADVPALKRWLDDN